LEPDGESVTGETLDDLDDEDNVVGENTYLLGVKQRSNFPELENNSGDEEVWGGVVRLRGGNGESCDSDRVKRQRILFDL